MVFDTDERSVQDGSPIELFKFTGTYNTYRLTNRGRDVTNSDGTYDSSFAIKRSSLEEGTQEDDDIALDVELSLTHPMVTEYVLSGLPPPSLRMEVFRAHPSDLNDTFKLFEGEVVSWSIRRRIAKLRVPSVFSFLFDGPLPRPKYQAPCNHVLGDARCGVDLTDPTNFHATTIASVSGTTVGLDSNPFADGECDAGQMISGSERRMITGNTGTSFTIATPFSSAIMPTAAVTIQRGCDHALNGDCINRFNNAVNFGGFPLVPDRNPFSSRL
ncbi:MAG: phage BR0599 family protein [Cyanobacteria bacterium J06638_20]